MPRKTKEEAQKTRAAIMKAAEKAFYERGVVSTSLQEVAVAAGVTRGAVYWHFRDKADLLRAIADEGFKLHEDLLDRLVAADLEDPLESLHGACVDSMRAITNDPQRRRVLTILTQRCEYLEEMEPLLARNQNCRDRVIERLSAILTQAQKKEQLSSAWAPRTAAVAMQSMIFGFIITEMEWPRPSPARDRVRTETIDAFFKALRG